MTANETLFRIVSPFNHTGYCTRPRRRGLSATNVQNEMADALTDESIKTIVSAMNDLPDDVMSYVMAYTPVSVAPSLARCWAVDF